MFVLKPVYIRIVYSTPHNTTVLKPSEEHFAISAAEEKTVEHYKRVRCVSDFVGAELVTEVLCDVPEDVSPLFCDEIAKLIGDECQGSA